MRNKRYTFRSMAVAALLLLTSLAPVQAADNQAPLTLQGAVTAAVRNNPAVAEMQKRWEEKKSRGAVAGSWPNPKLGIMKDDIPTGAFNPAEGMMTAYSFSQEIMFPGKLRLMGKMAENDAMMAQADYRNKQMDVYTEAKQAYYDLLYAVKALEIARENQQLMAQLLNIAQINYSTGMVPLGDTLKAQTEYAQMTNELPTMAAMEAVARAKLNTVMGRPANSSLTVKEEFNSPPPNFDLAALKKTALATRPALLGMQYQMNMAQSGVALAKKQQFPDFEFRLAYKDAKDEMTPDAWSVELMVMLPIWQEKNKGEIKAAGAGLAAARAALENMQNMTELDVEMAFTEAQAVWRQIDLYKNTIVPQAEQAYRAAVVSYANGKADFMTVLDGLATLRNVKLGYYKAKVDYEKAIANLEKAVGKPLFGDTGAFK